MKNVQSQSFFWSAFLLTRNEYEEIQTSKNWYLSIFYAVLEFKNLTAENFWKIQQVFSDIEPQLF